MVNSTRTPADVATDLRTNSRMDVTAGAGLVQLCDEAADLIDVQSEQINRLTQDRDYWREYATALEAAGWTPPRTDVRSDREAHTQQLWAAVRFLQRGGDTWNGKETHA